MDGVVQAIIARRRAASDPGRDLLAALLALRDEDGQGLSDAQVRGELFGRLLGAHETTSAAASWCLSLLCEHPSVADRRPLPASA